MSDLGCGCTFDDHPSWEEHIRDMVELEDTEHNFYTQVWKIFDIDLGLDIDIDLGL